MMVTIRPPLDPTRLHVLFHIHKILVISEKPAPPPQTLRIIFYPLHRQTMGNAKSP